MPDSNAAISTGCVRSACRRAKPKQALEQCLGTIGGLKRIGQQPRRALVTIPVSFLQDIESTGDWGQQIVEIVRHAAGQLAERLQLLGFMQLGHGRFALGGAILNALLEVGGELVQFLQPCARLILPAAAAQRRLGQADKRGRMERPLEEGDVSEYLEEPPGLGIALQPAAALGQKHERKVGPFGLLLEPLRQSMKIASADRLLGDDGKARTGLQQRDKLRNILDDIAAQPRLGQAYRAPRPRRVLGARGLALVRKSRSFTRPRPPATPDALRPVPARREERPESP